MESCNSNNEDEVSAVQSPRRKRTCSESQNDEISTSLNEKNSSESNETEQANKKPRLIGEEYQKLRQQLRERKKLLTSIPRFRIKGAGENASLTKNIDPRDRVPIFLSDIQHLLMYSLIGNDAPYSPSRWCHLEKFNKVSHTVVFIVEGLSMYHFSSYESLFPNITDLLEHRLEVVTPATIGGSVIEQLAAVPLTTSERKKLIDKYGSLSLAEKKTGDIVKLLKYVFPMQSPVRKNSPENDKIEDKIIELPPGDKFPRTQLLLSLSQLIDENYPLRWPGSSLDSKYKNYMNTKDIYLEATPKSPMFGLDCEMCKTTKGRELTRICIVDKQMNVVYETLVKPENKIVNYLTEYSGITEKLLKNVTTKLSDVQQKIKELLPSDAILVGQSLCVDLDALKMMHPYIIDTSVIFNITGNRNHKSKLQVLARKFLNERIQEKKGGHCPIEDARAALKLAQLKLANSIEFGDAFVVGQQNLEEMLRKQKPGENLVRDDDSYSFGVTIFKHVAKDKKTVSIVGTKEVLNDYSKYLMTSSLSIMDDANFSKDDKVRLVTGNSNKHVVSRASEISMEHALTICHIKLTPEKISEENLEKTCRNINKWVNKLWERMAVNGLACVIFGGQNNANGDGTKCYRKPTCILKPIKRFFLKTRIPPITGDCLKSMSQVPLMTEDRTIEENNPHNKVILEVGIPGDTWKYCVDRQALADKSEWFRALLMGDMAPPPSNPPPTICLQHVEKRAFDHLYKYFREEPINFNSVLTARATLDAAHYYLCPELAVIAVDYIIKNLNSSTVINVYHGLSLYALPEAEENEQIPSAPPENDAAEIAIACTRLLKACLTVIDSAPDEVLREEGFEELTVEEIASLASRDDLRLAKESILFEALEKWAASECRRRGIEPTSHNKRSAVSDEIWYSVRYLLMNDQEFIQGPMASGILSSEESAAIVAKILGHSNHQDNDQLARCNAPYRLSTTPRGRKTPTKAKFGMKPGKKEREDNKKNRRKECTSQGQRACARVGDLVVRVLACVFD